MLMVLAVLIQATLSSLLCSYLAQNDNFLFSDTKIMSFDAHSWFNHILDNAQSFGFTNITGVPTTNTTGFFWYNTGHPTEAVHRLLASAIDTQLHLTSD